MNLIYTLAYGDDALQQACLMVESLRRWGCYKDDIVVYTHKPYSIEGARTCHFPDAGGLWYLPAGKAWVGMTMDVSAYEKVLWMDSDVLAVNDIRPLFELGSGFWAPYDRAITPAYKLKKEWGLQREQVLNTGLVLGEAKHWNQFCRVWWERILTRRDQHKMGDMVDEPALNLLMQEERIQVSMMPENWALLLYHDGQRLDASTKLLHCTTLSKYSVMKSVVDLLKLHV